jgi:hypothetical protein
VRRLLIVAAASGAFAVCGSATAVAAGNPSGTGPPLQSCQAEPASPGNASSSPGSPFNEPTSTSPGGIGGQNYNEMSQYDVACYQLSTN